MFDEKKANTAVKFIKLLKHTQGEFARKPFNLMEFQDKIVRDLIGTLNEDGEQTETPIVPSLAKLAFSSLIRFRTLCRER